MARPILDAQLQTIRTQIIQLATVVETALDQALQAIPDADPALCGWVIAAERTIEDRRAHIERFTFRSLLLQQPLAGRDLRFLTSAPRMLTDLQHIGDQTTGIARLLVRIAPLRVKHTSQLQLAPALVSHQGRKHPSDPSLTEDTIVCALLHLGREAQRILRGTMRAFEEGDAQTAQLFCQEDDVVDVRYHLLRHDVMTMLAGTHALSALQQDPLIMQRLTSWLCIAHHLERVADHCTTLCQRIMANNGLTIDSPSPFVPQLAKLHQSLGDHPVQEVGHTTNAALTGCAPGIAVSQLIKSLFFRHRDSTSLFPRSGLLLTRG
jgi:phosphate transport system protein